MASDYTSGHHDLGVFLACMICALRERWRRDRFWRLLWNLCGGCCSDWNCNHRQGCVLPEGVLHLSSVVVALGRRRCVAHVCSKYIVAYNSYE